MRSKRLPMVQCVCGTYLSKKAKRIGEKICSACERKVRKQAAELAKQRASIGGRVTV